MKKTITLLVFVILLSTMLAAEGWQKSGSITFNLSQNNYSANWEGEERSNINWSVNLNTIWRKQLSELVRNRNTVKLAFGQTHNQELDEEGEKYWLKPIKSTDQIDLESMFRFTFGWQVDPFAALRFESQFIDKRIDDDTKMINPITITESFGLARQLIETEKRELTARTGIAFKQLLDAREDDFVDAVDGGLEFVVVFDTPLLQENIQYNTKLYLYQALYYSEEEDDPDDNWKALDVEWEHILSARLIGMFNMNLYVQLLYDKQIEDDIRFKQTLGLGLSYQLY